MANSFLGQIRLFAYFMIGVLFAFNTVAAFAAQVCYPKTKWVVVYNSGGNAPVTYMGDTKAEACGKLPDGPWTAGDTCWKYSTPYTGAWVYLNVNQKPICDDGTDPVGGVCKCPDPCSQKAGQSVDDGTVGPDNVKLSMSFSKRADSNYVGQSFCSGGCKAGVTKEVGSIGYADGDKYYGTFNAAFSGQSCDAGQTETDTKSNPGLQPKNTPEYDCVKQGKGYGYFNGNVICTTASPSKGTDSNTKTTTNADGSKTQVKTDTTVNCDGSVCVTTTTTTTTTFDSSGTQTGTSTKTDSTSKADPSSTGNGTKGDASFCSQNPTSPMCKEGSFTESCGAEPSCDGDPVQCATARATWKTRCALETSQQVATQGQNILDGQDAAAKDALVHKTEAMATIDTTGGGASGSCPADKQVPIGDKTLTIPFSSICAAADLMKIALLAIATFTAGMIIVGGIK